MSESESTEKLGVWLVGACGNVAATAAVGLAALQKGLAPLTGLVSESPPFDNLGLAEWGNIVAGGHDIRKPCLVATANRLAAEHVVPAALVESCQEELLAIEANIRRGITYRCGEQIRELAEVPIVDETQVAPRQLITQLQRDLQAFRDEHGLDRVVVVNVASTEPATDATCLPSTWPEAEPLLDNIGETAFVTSMLYAIAAMELEMPFVNFTPSLGASVPALEDLSQRKKVCHAGRDGKTGETLLKTVLAPMFAHRNLDVMSWVGHNIFGNLDGRVLDHPDNRATKVATKDKVLGGTLGYDPQTLVSIEYIESLGDWKTAWDHVHFRGFLGTSMTLQFTWQGSDSALAAPLVLDLARLVDRAAQAGNTGALGPLACFFKSPQGVSTHDFAEQHRMLLEWAAKLR